VKQRAREPAFCQSLPVMIVLKMVDRWMTPLIISIASDSAPQTEASFPTSFG